jgi:hypothetical protein
MADGGDDADAEMEELRRKVEHVMSNEVLPHVCTLSDEEIDEMCRQLFMYRQKRAAGAHLVIAHGLVTTGIFRKNPFTRNPLEVSKETAVTGSRATLIQAGVNQSEQIQEAKFNPEDVYRQRVEAIQHMLGGCGSSPPHKHSLGRFKNHASGPHNSRINQEIVQFY